MIIWADESKTTELMHIWQQSFGDSEEYIRLFLNDNFNRIKIPVYEVNGVIASVAYLLPMTYCDGAEAEASCYYLYAAATRKEYRGKGYFAALLQYIQDNVKEPVFLVPGEESLQKYYEKQGLFVWQTQKKMEYHLDSPSFAQIQKSKDSYMVSDLSSMEYFTRREDMLLKQPHMRWDADFIDYICKENIYCGGKQIWIKTDDTEYIIMYRINEGTLYIQEILPHVHVEKAVHVLQKVTACTKASFSMKPLVMTTSKTVFDKNGYFNLAMG